MNRICDQGNDLNGHFQAYRAGVRVEHVDDLDTRD